MKKCFYLLDGIGKAKYTVNFHDGHSKHKDGSDFFDMKIFRNKRIRDQFIRNLVRDGYKEAYPFIMMKG